MDNFTSQEPQQQQQKQQANLILTDNAVEISLEIREQITKKIEELRTLSLIHI